ncbi:MAG: hypothetical protein RLN79_08990 [Cytophagales bacterium]
MEESQNKIPKVFYHVGMGRAASTYLQYDVFPFFKNVTYIQRTRFKYFNKIVKRGKSEKYFVSREYDQQFDEEVEKFSKQFPDAHPIVVFRRHDGWIASQYRRFVKNGNHLTFKEFIDLENDKGLFSIADLSYYPKINYLEKHFSNKPLVVFYEEMINDPFTFIDRIANFMNASYNRDDINLDKRHSSYNKNQIRAIYWVGNYFNIRKRRVFNNSLLHFLWRIYLGSIRYSILYIAKILPDSMFNQGPLIEPEELHAVKEYFKEDWGKCITYAENHFGKVKF